MCHADPPATAFTMIGSNVSLVPLYSDKRSQESKIGKKRFSGAGNDTCT